MAQLVATCSGNRQKNRGIWWSREPGRLAAHQEQLDFENIDRQLSKRLHGNAQFVGPKYDHWSGLHRWGPRNGGCARPIAFEARLSSSKALDDEAE